MNGNQPIEVHYINTGFPYTVTESFMDLFEGLTYAEADVALADALQNQASPYWSMMHASSYKYGFSGPGSNSYYNYSHTYEVNDYVPRLDGGRRQWDNPASLLDVDMPQIVQHGGGATGATTNPSTEDCLRTQHATNSPQVIWQDNIDPDNMTYEELLDLGEAVGTQSRGLSQERISSLPVSKYKFSFCFSRKKASSPPVPKGKCSFFSRKKASSPPVPKDKCSFFSIKKAGERCVICQMDYKRGDRQMTLPCKHVYHASCVTRWLNINKACPVCFAEVSAEEPIAEVSAEEPIAEVFAEEPKHQ